MTSGTAIVQVGVVVIAVLGLWIGARALVDATVRVARRFGVGELTIGLTIVAMGTSTPELVVTVDAALAGLGEIGVGNIIGSNAYNLAFILGAVSLLRVIPVERSLVHRDGAALVLSTLVGAAALFDRTVTGVEGALLAGCSSRTPPTSSAMSARRARSTPSTRTRGSRERFRTVSRRGRDALLLVGGLALVLVSGHFMVEAASTTLARSAGVSDWAIGGTIVAAGTSTPELAVSLVAMRRGHVGMSVGNVVGSNVFNVLGIMGIAAFLRPLAVGGAAIETVLWLTVVTVVMVVALWSGRRLSRTEGALFVCSEVSRWTLGLLRIFG